MHSKAHLYLTAICGAGLVAELFGLSPWGAAVAIAAGGVPALGAAWRAVLRKELDVHVLMILAAVGAALLGHLWEAGALLFLFALAETLEDYAMARTHSAIEGLVKLRPDTALRVGDDDDREVGVESLKVGDLVRVAAFAQIPIDGVVTDGETTVDQSAMTGESRPVEKVPGDSLFAGTQNLESAVVMRVSAEVGDTTLDRIVELVRQAQSEKAGAERVSQWFGSRYTYFVILAFFVVLGSRLAFGQTWHVAVYASLSVLVALSPCAIVISTPAATLSALAWAARRGMLVRGGRYIEVAGLVDTVAFDKTGTLTMGQTLRRVCVCRKLQLAVGAGEHGEACWSGGASLSTEAMRVLTIAAAAEQDSRHPIAKAIVSAAQRTGADVPVATSHRSLPGVGVEAVVEGQTVKVGQKALFQNLPTGFERHVARMAAEGETVAIVEIEGEFAAIGLADTVRPEAKGAIDELRSLGINELILLTGDTEQSARAVAAGLSVDETHAELLPQEKEQVVRSKIDAGATLAVVGDGINDAPCLSRANLGIAMGGLGSDIALNAADVVLMNDRLDQVPQLVRLGRRTRSIIRANLFFAVGVIVLLLVASLAVDWIAPELRSYVLPLAVLGHEGSTVLVILNGLRLLR